MHALAERDDTFSVIHDCAKHEAFAGCMGQFSQPFEIPCVYGCRSLDLKPNQFTAIVLDDDIYFVLILVAVVIKGVRTVEPSRLFDDLRKHERFQDRPEDRAVLRNSLRGYSQELREQPTIKKVKLGRLHQSLEAISEPRVETTQKE